MDITRPSQAGARLRLALLTLGMALLASQIACSSGPGPEVAAAPTPDAGLRPGDVVRLKIWRAEDVTGDYVVDDRGIVSLPLVGDREVAGLAPSDLRDRLLAAYRTYFNEPALEVTVLRRINILGAVTQPGLYPVDATVSLSEALGLAGGITPEGDPDDIRLVRDGREIEVDLDRAMRLADRDIRSGDQLVVGQKGWFKRNPGALIGSLIAAAAGITIALIR